jgi:hypothetical protein
VDSRGASCARVTVTITGFFRAVVTVAAVVAVVVATVIVITIAIIAVIIVAIVIVIAIAIVTIAVVVVAVLPSRPRTLDRGGPLTLQAGRRSARSPPHRVVCGRRLVAAICCVTHTRRQHVTVTRCRRWYT